MIEYYQKVADLWPRYGEIDSTIVHQAIVVSLINLEMTSVCLGTYPPEKGYPCWQAMKQIQASPVFERLREKEKGVANLLDLYVARYETDAFAVAVTPKKPFDPALREELIAMTERAYAEKVHPDHWTADMLSGAHQPGWLRIRARSDDPLRVLEDHPRFLYADARHNESGRNRRDFLISCEQGYAGLSPRPI